MLGETHEPFRLTRPTRNTCGHTAEQLPVSRQIKFLALLACATGSVAGLTVSVKADSVLWYNGDNAGRGGGTANEVTTNKGSFRVYEDFVVTSPTGWLVTSVWSNDELSYTNITQADWTIRAGMSVGQAGTIVSSGVGPATLTPTGRFVAAVGRTEYTIQVSGLSLSLAPGTYWLSVSPLVGNDPSSPLMSYVSCTLGANAVGIPAGNNMNSLFVWEVHGLADYTDAFQRDYSLGVAGTLIPEPSVGLLFFAGGVLVVCAARSKF